MDLGVSVLAGLGGRHIDDLARATLDDDVTVLTQSRALHREGQRSAGIGRVEGNIMLLNRTWSASNYTRSIYKRKHRDLGGKGGFQVRVLNKRAQGNRACHLRMRAQGSRTRAPQLQFQKLFFFSPDRPTKATFFMLMFCLGRLHASFAIFFLSWWPWGTKSQCGVQSAKRKLRSRGAAAEVCMQKDPCMTYLLGHGD